MIILLIPVILYEIHLKVLLPAFKIAPGSKREMLSVPFQQTARVLNEHGTGAFSKEENEIITKILGDSSTLGKVYDPDYSDNVKNRFNKHATNEDLLNYFSSWFNNFFKYPTDYVQATVNNTYGYFYPNNSASIGFIDMIPLDRSSYDIKFVDKWQGERDILINANFAIKKLPVISMIYSAGFFVYFLMICIGYVIYKKNYKFLIVLMPLITAVLITLLGPVSGHWRYVLPIMFSFPIILSMTMYVSKNKNETT